MPSVWATSEPSAKPPTSPKVVDELSNSVYGLPTTPVSPTPAVSVAQQINTARSQHSAPSTFRIHDDELGKLISKAVNDFMQSPTWESFVKSQRVSSSDISANVKYLDHPARSYLLHLRNHGVPVPMQPPPWTNEKKDEVIARGCHESANKDTKFVREEFSDFIKKQFWTILPYRLVKGMRDLRLSPLGVVPQRDRRPRLIVDLTFFMVNHDCVPIAPSEAMQFGRALHRILQRILLADPRYGPIYIAKIDIADGFYRVGLAPRDAPKLGVMLPLIGDEEPMVAIPFVLPMGWVNSPPFFSALTETAADVMNKELNRNAPQPPHRLESLTLSDPVPPTVVCPTPAPAVPPQPTIPVAPPTTVPPPTEARPTNVTELPPTVVLPQPSPIPLVPRDDIHQPGYKRPMRYADIYVDDFLSLFQGTAAERLNATRTLLNVLDQVLRPLHPNDHTLRQEPASVKKLKKGDGTWSTRKTVLGWVLDTAAKTIELPPHRADRLLKILRSIKPGQRRTTAKVWHKLLGELRSMVIAIPGARGLFSTLQTAFATADDPTSHDGRRRLRLSKDVHTFLNDFRVLARELPTRPTRIAELLPRSPSVIGATDASGIGMGGVAFVATAADIQAVLWRQSFPSKIRQQLVSFENPTGDVTNSDLELAATVAHHDVLTANFDLREHTIHSFHDNTPAQYWQRKGSTTTLGPAASLLRLQSHHQRHFRYVPVHDYLAGVLNRMGDDASRLFELSDAALLTYFNRHYPQTTPWRLLPLRPEWHSLMISSLAKKPSAVVSSKGLKTVLTGIGPCGSISAKSLTSTHSSAPSVIPFHFSKSSRHATADDLAVPRTAYDLARFRTRSDRWARRWPAWGPRTYARMGQAH